MRFLYKVLSIGALFLLLYASPIAAQNISIPGITGVDFDTTGGSYSIAFSTNFNVHGVDITSSGLTLSYNDIDETLSLYGTASASFDGETVDVGFGDSGDPGLIITNGSLTQLNFSITSQFSLNSLSLTPVDLGMWWGIGTSSFSILGTLKAAVGTDTLTADLGSTVLGPGITVTDGVVTDISMTISANFEIESLSVTPDILAFSYSEADSRYEIWGDVTIDVDGNQVGGALGSFSNPGFLITNGSLTSFNIGVSGDFDLKAITITTSDLTFQWDSGNSQFEMFGSGSTNIDGNGISISLGDEDDPGLIVNSGTVTHINFGITADFDMKGITISPNDLTLEYDLGNTQYEFYGSVAVKFDGEEVAATLGDSNNPGVVYKSGSITHVNFGLTAEFTVKSLSVSPTNLTFEYDSGNNHFEMYGDLTFRIGSDQVTANMGDAINPGLIYQNNAIQHVNIGVTSDFNLKGLKVKTNNLGADWNSGSDYHIYGDADLSIENENIDVNFGTFNDPGIVVRNGDLLSFEVDVNSDLRFGNFEVRARDLDIHYVSNIFQVRGEVDLKEIFELTVNLGNGGQPGLEIDVSGAEPRFKIEDLRIDIQHANLGAIDLKNFELEFNTNGIVESDVDVIFPTGTEIDAKLKFVGNPAKLNSIDIAYRANNLSEAIEIFEGVQIALLEASVTNLVYPAYLEVSGKLETIYGGGFILAGHQATFLEMTDQVTITSSSLSFDASVNVGAYRSGPDTWNNLIGYGDINLFAQFGQYVRVTADVRIPGDPLIEADAVAYLDSHGHFDALVDVQFIVPRWVPFIGGKHFGSVDGAVRYNRYDLNGSYGAAWVSYHIGGGGRHHRHRHTHYVGAKYDFGTRKIRFIGKRAINGIRSTILNEVGKVSALSNPNTLPNINVVHTFFVEQPAPNSMLIHIDWAEPVDSAIVSVIGPEGVYELTKAIVVSENDSTTAPTLGFEENMNLIVGDTTTSFIFTTPTANSDEEIKEASLLDGRYQLVVSFHGDTAAIDTVQFLTMWQEPESNILVEETGTNRFNLESDYWSSLPDSTFISFYVAGVGPDDEVKLLEHVQATNFDDNGYGKETLSFIPDFIERLDTLHFYTVIDDRVNPPIQSDSSAAFIYQPDIFGTLNFPIAADSLKGGLRVFVDEDVDGSFDVASTGGLELFGITDSTGYFAISGLIPKENYEVRIVLPEGYRLVGGIDRFSSRIFNFAGNPVELVLNIEAYTEDN